MSAVLAEHGGMACAWCGAAVDALVLDTGPPARKWNEPCGCAFPRPADPNPMPALRLFRSHSEKPRSDK